MSDGHNDEPPEWAVEWMADLHWLGAETASYQARGDQVEFLATFPGHAPVREEWSASTEAEILDAAGWFTNNLRTRVASGLIQVAHDWGLIVTYRLNEADLRRLDIASRIGRPMNTPVILGHTKVADHSGPACLRCGQYRGKQEEHCPGWKS